MSGPSDEPPAEVRDSRWWRLIAAAAMVQFLVGAVAAVVFYFVFGLGRTRVLGVGETEIAIAMAALSVPTFLVVLALPYALYRDLELLEGHVALDRWGLERHHYTIAAAAGIFVPFVSFAVAVLYLYQRHVRVGVP